MYSGCVCKNREQPTSLILIQLTDNCLYFDCTFSARCMRRPDVSARISHSPLAIGSKCSAVQCACVCCVERSFARLLHSCTRAYEPSSNWLLLIEPISPILLETYTTFSIVFTRLSGRLNKKITKFTSYTVIILVYWHFVISIVSRHIKTSHLFHSSQTATDLRNLKFLTSYSLKSPHIYTLGLFTLILMLRQVTI